MKIKEFEETKPFTIKTLKPKKQVNSFDDFDFMDELQYAEWELMCAKNRVKDIKKRIKYEQLKTK